MKRIFTLFVALAMACVVCAAECVIVPRPVSFEPQKGKVTLTSKSVIYVADKSLVRPATMFCSYVATEKGLQLSVVESQPKGKGVISLSIDKSLATEEYLLEVTKQGIVIKGGSEQGVFYGLQSLRQVVFHSKGNAKKVSVECMTVYTAKVITTVDIMHFESSLTRPNANRSIGIMNSKRCGK